MDILAVLRFVLHHNDKVFGVLVALFLVTSILLLIRSLTERADSGASASGGNVDIKSIEKAMRNVLGSTAVTVSSGPAAVSAPRSAPVSASSVEGAPVDAGPSNPLENEIVSQLLKEREQQVEELTKNLESVRAELKSVKEETAGMGPTFELETKISELQARLAEYEIIEDDIADLSIFKEENERLKVEVTNLKAQLESARQAQAAAPKAGPKIAGGAEIDLKFEKADKFELDPNDDVMKAFAQAVGAPSPIAAAVQSGGDSAVLATAEKFALSVDDDVMKQFAEATGSQVIGNPAPAAPEPDASTPAPGAAEDPQAAIDAIFNQAKAAPAAEAPATPAGAEDPQAAIDAIFNQAKAAPAAAEDPQAAIDAIFNQAKAAPAAEAPAIPAAAEDPQAAIDAIFNQAKAAPAAAPAPAPASPAAAEDPQAAIDAIFNQAKAAPAAEVPAPSDSSALPDLSEVAAAYEQTAKADAAIAESQAVPLELDELSEIAGLEIPSEPAPSRPPPDEAQLTALLDQIKIEPIDDPQARIDEMLAQAKAERAQGAAAPSESVVAAEAESVSEALSGDLDKEKMLSELESLDVDSIQDQSDVLEGALDTDKLLHEAEAAGLDGAGDAPGVASAPAPEQVSAAVQPAAEASAADQEPEPVVPPQPAVKPLAPEDDLLAEFTDDGKE